MTLQLTDEQLAIVSSTAKILVVKAFAGSGKSSSLKQYAIARPRQRFLYLAFNRSAKDDAKDKFPPNVTCMTTHGVALQAVNQLFGHKIGETRANELGKLLSLPFADAYATLKVIEAFTASADQTVNETHVTKVLREPGDLERWIRLATRVWGYMTDPKETRVKIPHDGYLKFFQLRNPVIDRGFDAIMLDEAQDANPCTIAILANQKCNKIIVGDHHQAIYGFRGAVDALDAFEATETLHLTNSFRFGDVAAGFSTKLLQHFKGEKKAITGLGPYRKMGVQVDNQGQIGIIARTNGTLFDEAISLNQNQHAFHFIGGVKTYPFQKILDVYHLKERALGQISDPYWRTFETFSNLEAYGKEVDDREIKSLISVVNRHGHKIPKHINEIKATAIEDQKNAYVCLTTAHKAKGLEFDQVLLLDDFASLTHKDLGVSKHRFDIPAEEINLLYVAATRGIRNLQPNESMNAWLNYLENGPPVTPQKTQPVIHNEPKEKPEATAPIVSITPADLAASFATDPLPGQAKEPVSAHTDSPTHSTPTDSIATPEQSSAAQDTVSAGPQIDAAATHSPAPNNALLPSQANETTASTEISPEIEEHQRTWIKQHAPAAAAIAWPDKNKPIPLLMNELKKLPGCPDNLQYTLVTEIVREQKLRRQSAPIDAAATPLTPDSMQTAQSAPAPVLLTEEKQTDLAVKETTPEQQQITAETTTLATAAPALPDVTSPSPNGLGDDSLAVDQGTAKILAGLTPVTILALGGKKDLAIQSIVVAMDGKFDATSVERAIATAMATLEQKGHDAFFDMLSALKKNKNGLDTSLKRKEQPSTAVNHPGPVFDPKLIIRVWMIITAQPSLDEKGVADLLGINEKTAKDMLLLLK